MDCVFVYGSLRQGMENHDVLGRAEFLGSAMTRSEFQLLDLGRYPAVVPGESTVIGEVYRVDRETLTRLDIFERVPELYVRQETTLDDGSRAWIYLYNADRPMTCPCVPQGDWTAWRQKR